MQIAVHDGAAPRDENIVTDFNPPWMEEGIYRDACTQQQDGHRPEYPEGAGHSALDRFLVFMPHAFRNDIDQFIPQSQIREAEEKDKRRNGDPNPISLRAELVERPPHRED